MRIKNILQVVFYYSLAFRAYIIISLISSFFLKSSSAYAIASTNDGFQLTIFQIEYYCLVAVLFAFRPSRFRGVIMRSYLAEQSKEFDKKTFFRIVYIGVLLAVFGIPYLLFKNAIHDILADVMDTNQYILDHTYLLLISLFFLLLNFLDLYYSTSEAAANAKNNLFKGLYTMALIIPIGLIIYLISMALGLKPDVLVVLCLSFNFAFFYLSLQVFWGCRKATYQVKNHLSVH
ncbi:hypothetical protein [Pedobacter frigidisoli]|uniref:hypothetical protein n=1 Tax=Pedobacter frigidisoli TaxID=2530455 RepID=UPI00292DE38C|nr:hypothetical protein [Pedobacter frigidisoli]